MSGCLGDVRVSVRQLAKAPGFTFAAALVLALGIGLNAGMFSLVYAFGLAGRPYAEPDRLVQLYSSANREPDSYRAFSYPAYLELAAQHDLFSGVLAHHPAIVGIADGGSESRRAFAAAVSRNYFDVLGVPIIRGRGFTEDESRPGADIPVAIASYAYWQRAGFAADFLGRTIRVNERPFTIVGITPRDFTGTMSVFGPDLYFPFGVFRTVSNDFQGETTRTLERVDAYNLFLVARLQNGVSRDAAGRLSAAARRLEQAYPAEYKDARLTSNTLPRFGTSTSPSDETMLAVLGALLLGLTGAVLLTVCLNLASMLMARGTARRKELAIRLALGSSRARIVRQLLIEGLLLSLVGGAGGAALGLFGVSAVVRAFQGRLPISIVLESSASVAAVGATVFFCVIATLWFALGPALRHSRADVMTDLKQHAGERAPLRRRFMPRNPLVVSQVALSLALLIAAGLFVRMAQTAMWVDFGFRADQTLLAEVDSRLGGYSTPDSLVLYAQLEQRLAGLPGAHSAAVGSLVPLGMVNISRSVQRAGILVPRGAAPNKPEDGQAFDSPWNSVSGSYFDAMGVPLLQGRPFSAVESYDAAAPAVAVIDETLARKLWPDGSALGQRVQFRSGESGPEQQRNASYEVVGIVGSTRRQLFEKQLPGAIYVPFAQGPQANAYFHVRPASAAIDLSDAVRREIRTAAPALPLFGVRTFPAHVGQSIEYWSLGLIATLFASFGLLAMIVAIVGVYGVMSYSVARRTREIGIRIAVGAMPGTVRGMIMRESLSMTVLGLGGGWLLGVGTGRILSSVFVDLAGFDVPTFTVLPAAFLLTAAAAAWLPARRATRVNPVTALRAE